MIKFFILRHVHITMLLKYLNAYTTVFPDSSITCSSLPPQQSCVSDSLPHWFPLLNQTKHPPMIPTYRAPMYPRSGL